MNLLAEIYSGGNKLKRLLGDFVSDPIGNIQQAVGHANDRAGNLNRLTSLAAQEHFNSIKTGAPMGQAQNKLAQLMADAYNPMGIVSVSAAKGLKTPISLPDDDIFRAAVEGTNKAQITDDGLLMSIQRNQNADQSMRPSVRGGVFYLPEGAAQAKHYSTGENGYGGSEKIVGETLIKNPAFVKGATGGKAPEAAYDMALGKGAYQAMREDALKAYGGFGSNPSNRIELVEGFLEKYAPELSGQGQYIVQNSKQGNQLAYALQEAAVGSKMRELGHDAVLGYSKGKQGPFISEVFDVRESVYPDKFGGFQVWDQFK